MLKVWFYFQKKTCLCVAVDVTKCDEILQIVEKTAGYICAVKLHADVIEDFSDDFVLKLKSLADNFNFIIFEDRFVKVFCTLYNRYIFI